MNSKTSPNGFTLLEMLIYIAVISLVIGAVGAMLLWSVRSQAKMKMISEVSWQGERALAVMTKEIREAAGVYTPTSVFGVHPGQLSLQTAGSVPPGENFGYIDFFLCGTRLCLKRESQNPIALTSDSVVVDNLVFSLVSATADFASVQIALTLRYNSPAQQPGYQASVSFQSSSAIRSPRQ